jgi:hypothetical protein
VPPAAPDWLALTAAEAIADAQQLPAPVGRDRVVLHRGGLGPLVGLDLFALLAAAVLSADAQQLPAPVGRDRVVLHRGGLGPLVGLDLFALLAAAVLPADAQQLAAPVGRDRVVLHRGGLGPLVGLDLFALLAAAVLPADAQQLAAPVGHARVVLHRGGLALHSAPAARSEFSVLAAYFELLLSRLLLLLDSGPAPVDSDARAALGVVGVLQGCGLAPIRSQFQCVRVAPPVVGRRGGRDFPARRQELQPGVAHLRTSG